MMLFTNNSPLLPNLNLVTTDVWSQVVSDQFLKQIWMSMSSSIGRNDANLLLIR